MEIDDHEGFTFNEADVKGLKQYLEQQTGKKWSLPKVRAMLNKHRGFTKSDFAATAEMDKFLLSEFAKVPHEPTDTVGEVLGKEVLDKAAAIFNSTQMQASGRKLS